MAEHARQMHQRGIPFIFDPGQRLPQFNGAENGEMLGRRAGSPSTTTKARMLCDRTGESLHDMSMRDNIEGVVVTLADQGCDVWQRGVATRVPGVPARAVVDPTGCGDAFRAGLLFGLERGWPLQRCGGAGQPPGRAQDRASRWAKSPL